MKRNVCSTNKEYQWVQIGWIGLMGKFFFIYLWGAWGRQSHKRGRCPRCSMRGGSWWWAWWSWRCRRTACGCSWSTGGTRPAPPSRRIGWPPRWTTRSAGSCGSRFPRTGSDPQWRRCRTWGWPRCCCGWSLWRNRHSCPCCLDLRCRKYTILACSLQILMFQNDVLSVIKEIFSLSTIISSNSLQSRTFCPLAHSLKCEVADWGWGVAVSDSFQWNICSNNKYEMI